MAIYRNKTQQFTVVAQSLIRDDRLALKDLGLLVRLLSLPDNWEFNERGLYSIFEQDGKASIRTGLKNLERLGYLKRVQKHENGRFTNIEWSIYDTPQKPCSEKQNTEKQNTEKQCAENVTQYNTNQSITNNSITNREGKGEPASRFIPPTLEDVQAYCQERKNKVDPGRFIDYYASKGWYVGKNKMKDWRAAVRNWERSEKAAPITQNINEIDYSIPDIFLT